MSSDVAPPPLAAVRVEQRLGQAIAPTLSFRDEAGRPVTLGDYLGKDPLLVAIVTYQCRNLCGDTLDGVVRALGELPTRPYGWVVASLDPNEPPELALKQKRRYLARLGRQDGARWHFLTGPDGAELSKALGYGSAYDPVSHQYAHPSSLAFLTPRGTISRYLFGPDVAPLDLRLALSEAGEGRVGPRLDRILLRCFRFDGDTGRYSLAILGALRWGAIATVAIVVGAIARALRRERRRAP